HCVLLDLGLPDASGLEGLRQVLSLAPRAAVVVLTGLADRGVTVQAMATGAQDYLVKGEIDSAVLIRSVRYAVERRRADESARLLFEAQLRQDQNARLERGLLPQPLIRDPALAWASRYRPCGVRALVGGDFFDAVELPDGSLRMVVGDVAGHGPDEAALGIGLRIAWRTLVLSDHPPDEVLPAMEKVLSSERLSPETFTTVCDVTLAGDRRSMLLRLAGHPPPLRLEPFPALLADEHRGPPLGVVSGARWPGSRLELGSSWSLLLYTDGLVESHSGSAEDGLCIERLLDAAAGFRGSGLAPRAFVDRILEQAKSDSRGHLDDDVAMFLLATVPEPG
ncbi:MAG: PP2C family protein-serine/threonine phosphatase, partial [Acidimicrobiia bacterium]